MSDGKAVLRDGRTLTAHGTFQEMVEWAKDLAVLHGTVEVTITEVN